MTLGTGIFLSVLLIICSPVVFLMAYLLFALAVVLVALPFAITSVVIARAKNFFSRRRAPAPHQISGRG